MGPGGLHAMDTDSNEGLLGITKEFHVKTFGNIFNKVNFILYFKKINSISLASIVLNLKKIVFIALPMTKVRNPRSKKD